MNGFKETAQRPDRFLSAHASLFLAPPEKALPYRCIRVTGKAVYPDCSIIREDNPTPPSRDELADIQSLFTARIKHVNVLGRETEPDGISDFQWQAIIQNEYDLR